MVLRRKPAGLSMCLLLLLTVLTGMTAHPVRAQQFSPSVHLQPAGIQLDPTTTSSGTITVSSPWEGQAMYLPPGQSTALWITGTASVSDGEIAVQIKIDNEVGTRNAEVDATGNWSYQWSVPAGTSLGPHTIKATLNNGLAAVEVHIRFINTPPGDIALIAPLPGTVYPVPDEGNINIRVTGTATSSSTPIVVSLYFDGDPTPHAASFAGGTWSYTWTVNSSTRLGRRTIRVVLNNGEAYVQVDVWLVRLLFMPMIKR